MHISAECLPILSGAYCGCMQTPNQPSLLSPLRLSLIHPTDALFFITIQHFTTWMERLTIEVKNLFSTTVSAFNWHSQTHTIINLY